MGGAFTPAVLAGGAAAAPAVCLPPGSHVARRELVLAGRALRFYQVSDPEALLDALPEELYAEDERFPYWAEAWPSGIALATFLLRHRIGGGAAAIELGCGLGIAGVAAALMGADVLFTDVDPDALAFARANHELNLGRPGRTRLVDWRSPPADIGASLVIAADVLYERRFFEPFLGALRAVTRPGGAAYVAEPGRDLARGVLERLAREGFEHDLRLEEVDLEGRAHPVWIHELRRHG